MKDFIKEYDDNKANIVLPCLRALPPVTDDDLIWIRLLDIDIDICIESLAVVEAGSIYRYLSNFYKEHFEDNHGAIAVCEEMINNHDYILVDWEGDITRLCANEYSFNVEHFEIINDVINNLNRPIEVVLACHELFNDIDNLESNLQKYHGHYDSDTDLAYSHINDGLCDEVPDWLTCFIDYEKLGLHLSWDYSEHDGYYFYNS